MRKILTQLFTILFLLIVLMPGIDCSRFTTKKATVNAPKKSNVPIGPFTQNELQLLEDYKDYYSLKADFLKESEKTFSELNNTSNSTVQPPAPETLTNTTTTVKNEPAPPREQPEQAAPSQVQTGKASYYADKFHGRKTASGELYDRNKLTCAHRTLPFGTMCNVTNITDGKSVQVRVNDRGPFSKNRIVDLSERAFKLIGNVSAGVIDVKLEVIHQ